MTDWALLAYLGFAPWAPQLAIIDFYNETACVSVSSELKRRLKIEDRSSYRYICFNRRTGEVAQ